MYSPLEQFKLDQILVFYCNFANILIDLSISNSSFILLIITCTFIGISKIIINENKLITSKWKNILINYKIFLTNIVDENLGKDQKIYLPFIFTLFTYLVLINTTGFIPFVFTPTTQLIIALGFSFTIWWAALLRGISKNGSIFFSAFMPSGTPIILALLLVPIELLSFCARALSLGLRLCINVSTGHLLQLIIAEFSQKIIIKSILTKTITQKILLLLGGAIPALIIFILAFLEFGILIMQAFVFTTLAAIYFSDSENLH